MQEILKNLTKNSVVNLPKINEKAIKHRRFFLKQVGQSDKSLCPTVKSLQTKEKTVGGHTQKNSQKKNQVQNALKSQKEAKRRLLQLEVFNNLIKELSPKIKIKDDFFFNRYSTAIRNELDNNDYLLLKQLIKTFTILNSRHRNQIDENTYQVSEEDYLFAFRLLKWKNKPLKKVIKPEYVDFLELIEWYFDDEPFTSRKVSEKLQIPMNKVSEIIKFYIQEQKIERLSIRTYRLIINL